MVAELHHVDRWAESNNLKLNRAKSTEIIITDCKRQPTHNLPPLTPGIRCVTSINMLGITITNHLSIGEHVRDVISKCEQSLYALKLLCNHGMSDCSLKHVYKAVVLSKLLYASPAWWGFTSAADKQRLEASIRRAVRSGVVLDLATPEGCKAELTYMWLAGYIPMWYIRSKTVNPSQYDQGST